MSHIVTYVQVKNAPPATAKTLRAVNDAAALKDCKFYLGGSRQLNIVARALYNDMHDITGSKSRKLHHAHGVLDWVGIRGRWPVRAMVRYAMKITEMDMKETRRA